MTTQTTNPVVQTGKSTTTTASGKKATIRIFDTGINFGHFARVSIGRKVIGETAVVPFNMRAAAYGLALEIARKN